MVSDVTITYVLDMYFKYKLSIEFFRYKQYRDLNISCDLPYQTFEQWLGVEKEDVCQK